MWNVIYDETFSLGFWTWKVTNFSFHVSMILRTTEERCCPSRWLVDTRNYHEKGCLSQQHATRANTPQQPIKSYSWCTIWQGVSKVRRIKLLSLALTKLSEKKIENNLSEERLVSCNGTNLFNWRQFGSMGSAIQVRCKRWWNPCHFPTSSGLPQR